jgi:hypothetical protein
VPAGRVIIAFLGREIIALGTSRSNISPLLWVWETLVHIRNLFVSGSRTQWNQIMHWFPWIQQTKRKQSRISHSVATGVSDNMCNRNELASLGEGVCCTCSYNLASRAGLDASEQFCSHVQGRVSCDDSRHAQHSCLRISTITSSPQPQACSACERVRPGSSPHNSSRFQRSSGSSGDSHL